MFATGAGAALGFFFICPLVRKADSPAALGCLDVLGLAAALFFAVGFLGAAAGVAALEVLLSAFEENEGADDADVAALAARFLSKASFDALSLAAPALCAL